jgi:ribosomal protein S18 acetylase RimI-like enzyme
MDVTIRTANENDLPAVFALIKEFAAYLGRSASVKTSIEDFKRNKDSFICFLAETDEGDTAGYVLFCYSFHTWTGKAIYIDDLYIRDEYRRCSVGTKLIEAIIRYAKENKCKTLRWEVIEWNDKAIAFYKKLGAVVGDDNLNCSYTIR